MFQTTNQKVSLGCLWDVFGMCFGLCHCAFYHLWNVLQFGCSCPRPLAVSPDLAVCAVPPPGKAREVLKVCQKLPSKTVRSPPLFSSPDVPKSAKFATDVPLLQRFPMGINGGWCGDVIESHNQRLVINDLPGVQFKSAIFLEHKLTNPFLSNIVKIKLTIKMVTRCQINKSSHFFDIIHSTWNDGGHQKFPTGFVSLLLSGLFDGGHFKSGFLVLGIGLHQVLVHNALEFEDLWHAAFFSYHKICIKYVSY